MHERTRRRENDMDPNKIYGVCASKRCGVCFVCGGNIAAGKMGVRSVHTGGKLVGNCTKSICCRGEYATTRENPDRGYTQKNIAAAGKLACGYVHTGGTIVTIVAYKERYRYRCRATSPSARPSGKDNSLCLAPAVVPSRRPAWIRSRHPASAHNQSPTTGNPN